MKKMFLALAVLVLIPALSHAQLFEAVGNPIVVAGAAYQLEKPESGNQVAFMLSSNVAGVKLSTLPLYIGGVGVAVPTAVSQVSSQFGNYIMLTIPGITWYPKGNDPGVLAKICLQVGYSYVLNSDVKDRNSIYAGVGFGWDSPAYLKYKREVKKAKLKGLNEFPPNPYDVK